jgi:hypothetical protein
MLACIGRPLQFSLSVTPVISQCPLILETTGAKKLHHNSSATPTTLYHLYLYRIPLNLFFSFLIVAQEYKIPSHSTGESKTVSFLLLVYCKLEMNLGFLLFLGVKCLPPLAIH